MSLPIKVDKWGRLKPQMSEMTVAEALETMVGEPSTRLLSGQRCDELTQLDLRGQPIDGLPTGLHRLKNIEALYLSDNGLSELPDDLGLFPKLKTLSLGKNFITALPEGLGELWASLVNLYLGHNVITELPFDVSTMAYLKVGSIGTNPIPEPIDTVCWMLRAYAKEMPERLGYLVANAWSSSHQSTHAAIFLNQAVSLARQMNEPMVYEALYSDTRIDDQGVIQWGGFFCPEKAHLRVQRRQLGLSLLPHITRGACVHPSLWAQNVSVLDLSSEEGIWDWGVTALPIQALVINDSIAPPMGWLLDEAHGTYRPKSSSIS